MAASCIPPAPQQSLSGWGGSGSICWIALLGVIIYFWRPEITDDCDISCLLIWQEIFSFHNCFMKEIHDQYLK